MRKSQTMKQWAAIAWLMSIPLLGCAEAGKGTAVSLSIAANRDTELMVGDSLTFSVRSVKSDGSSEEVTSTAKCTLSGDATGTLAGTSFTATAPGSSVIACGYQQASGTLVITVRGSVQEEATIEGIQAGDVEPGSILKLTNLVVTALTPPTSSGVIDFFVQPEKGAAGTGLFVFDARASLEPVLAVGDVVEVTGTYIEEAGRSTIEAELIKKTGSATPRVTDLKLLDLDLAAHESALVRVKDLAVRDLSYSSYTWLLSDSKDASLEMELDTYFFEPSTEQGSVLDTLTGIVFCSMDICGVAPRDEADIVLCSGCEKVDTVPPAVTPPGTQTMTKIEDIQTGTLAVGGAVVLEDVVVTAVWPDGDNLDFWAQSPGGGKSSGLFFRDARPTPSALALTVGSLVRIEGVTALRANYPVVNYALAEEKSQNSKVTIDQVSLSELADTALGRPYWGALVEIADLSVMEIDASGYGVVVQHSADGTAGFVGNALFSELPLAVNDTVSRLTGVVYLSASGLEIWPRDAQDLVR